ncbi:MAG: hypothetical protein Q8O26_06375 [Phreatobacter sp.]|uniref:hypothetical protein n=1 Tax=Phreatobacter sp. TaxID=1966341 RepID=UPI002736FF97|nr:hypothetical protein [Phreatobacter sp.]MDP2801493.1 hypothetical protein [Phreatobacter sp.]
MRLLRQALGSRRGLILLGLAAAWVLWQAWLFAVAPAKIAGGFPERARVNAVITLPFAPERFHILVFQRYGRVSGTEGNSVELRGIDKSQLGAIARHYWVRRIEPLQQGG